MIFYIEQSYKIYVKKKKLSRRSKSKLSYKSNHLFKITNLLKFLRNNKFLNTLNLFKLNFIKFKDYVTLYQQLSLSFIINSKNLFNKSYIKTNYINLNSTSLVSWYSNLKRLSYSYNMEFGAINDFLKYFKNLNYNLNLSCS